MLVLSRKVGERIQIGDDVTITVVRINANAVRIGIDAPGDREIVREEIAERNLGATAGSASNADGSTSRF